MCDSNGLCLDVVQTIDPSALVVGIHLHPIWIAVGPNSTSGCSVEGFRAELCDEALDGAAFVDAPRLCEQRQIGIHGTCQINLHPGLLGLLCVVNSSISSR